jgi:hypothetical protein
MSFKRKEDEIMSKKDLFSWYNLKWADKEAVKQWMDYYDMSNVVVNQILKIHKQGIIDFEHALMIIILCLIPNVQSEELTESSLDQQEVRLSLLTNVCKKLNK